MTEVKSNIEHIFEDTFLSICYYGFFVFAAWAGIGTFNGVEALKQINNFFFLSLYVGWLIFVDVCLCMVILDTIFFVCELGCYCNISNDVHNPKSKLLNNFIFLLYWAANVLWFSFHLDKVLNQNISIAAVYWAGAVIFVIIVGSLFETPQNSKME